MRRDPEPARLADAAGVDATALQEAAQIVVHGIQKVLIFNKDYRGLRLPNDERIFAQVAAELGCSVLALREKSNAQRLLDMGANPRWLPGYAPIGDAAAVEALEKEWCVASGGLDTTAGDVGSLLREKKIKVAVVLGEDPLGCEGFPRDLRQGLLAAEFLVVGDLFFTKTAERAHVVLPLSSPAETSGTSTNLERRVQRLQRAIPPVAGLETWEMLCALAARMGYRFKMKCSSAEDVTAEIRRVVPLYRNVVIDSEEPDSIWDLGALGQTAQEFEASRAATAVRPAPTLGLDVLEVRFQRWFDGLMAGARRDLQSRTATD